MVGKGRPPTGKPILIRIPDDLLQKIDTEAAANGRSRAAQIRHTLTNHTKDQP